MSNIAVTINKLSKKYVLGRNKKGSIKDTFATWFSEAKKTEEFWALKDVSFEVERGEAIGIIGKNGAGKSTLLKILSRITDPTSGRVVIDGRVSSLLEVGTGFHPELTGRENVFLNGTILGMSRSEVKAKFDEIVAFSGVEKFLDTPVKHYSSGMTVRLAFAVAAHLEPEILIIDEVLAVGDAEFQRKCLGKMEDVTSQGRTILFVSHNMSAVRNLCSKAIQLKHGQVICSGATEDVINSYIDDNAATENTIKRNGEISWDMGHAPGGSEVKLLRVRLKNDKDIVKNHFDTSEALYVELSYYVAKPIKGMRIVLKVSAHDGTLVFASTDHNSRDVNTSPGFYRTVCRIPPHIFNKISYYLELNFGIPSVKVLVPQLKALDFEVENIFSSTGSYFPERWPGLVAIPTEWETQMAESKVT